MPRIEDFVTNFFSNPNPDLTAYKDELFCSELRLHALLAIHPMIDLIHKYQQGRWMRAHIPGSNTILNKPHINSGLTILDYCIAAGLNDIAAKAIALGCETSLSTQRLQQLGADAGNSKSPATADMLTIVEQLTDHRRNTFKNKTIVNNYQNSIQKFSKYLHGDYKYMLGAFVLGLVFVISYFLFSGLVADTVLCLGIGSLSTGAALRSSIKYEEKTRAMLAASQATMAETIKIAQLLELSSKELKLNKIMINAQHHHKKADYVDDNHMFYLPSVGETLRENKKLAFDIASILGFKNKAKP